VLVLAVAAVIWGCGMVYVALYPGASGEFGGFSVLFAAMVDIPVGLVSLVVGLVVKKGPRCCDGPASFCRSRRLPCRS
jgi:hypothetical protein